MERKYVKKEIVEKQLCEIYELIQQIDCRMDEVIKHTIDLSVEEIELQVEEINEQLDSAENQSIVQSLSHNEMLRKTIPVPGNVSSKLHFV